MVSERPLFGWRVFFLPDYVGSSPVELFGRDGGDEGLLLAQESLLQGQFARQWALRVTAQEAALS